MQVTDQKPTPRTDGPNRGGGVAERACSKGDRQDTLEVPRAIPPGVPSSSGDGGSASVDGGHLTTLLLSDGTLATLAAAMIAVLVKPRLFPRTRGRVGGPAEWRAVAELGRTVHVLVAADGTIRSITPNASRVLGTACDRAAELGLTLRDVVQPEHVDSLDDWIGRAWLSEMPPPLMAAVVAPGGAPRWLELATSGRIPWAEAEALLIEIRDGTERARESRRLALLGGAVATHPDAVFITDADGRIEHVNAAFQSVTGFRGSAAIGAPSSALGSGRHPPDFFRGMWQTIQAGETYRGEVTNRRPDGTEYTLDLTITPLRDVDGVLHYMATGRDVSRYSAVLREREDSAYCDALTGAVTSRLLRERAVQILPLARRSGRIAALIRIDVERLRLINDRHGRETGDAVLSTLARRLAVHLGVTDTIARDDADSFLILLGDVADEISLARGVRRMVDATREPFPGLPADLAVHAHVGVALFPHDAGTYEELTERAAAALHRCRQARSPFEFFDRDLSLASYSRLELEEDLHWAWERDQFLLYFQPVADRSGRTAGIEGLARWRHLERGLLTPEQFLPIAERTGRIISLDRWAFATAVRQAVEWSAGGWNGWVSVNLSARSLHDPELPEYVARILSEGGLGPRRMVVEISEDAAMRDRRATARALAAFREAGVAVALDHFGVGHASLACLRLFAADVIKLDPSFIQDARPGTRDARLLEMVIALAHGLGTRVVAEGVERPDQRDWLLASGCDLLQGHLVGRAVPPGEFHLALRDTRREVEM